MNSSKLCHSPEKIRVPLGFTFSALAAGIKVSGRPDLALIEAPGGAAGAALFTSNLVVAAPVEVGRASLASLAASGGRVRAVIVNSGNANCATGRAGFQACERVCRDAAKILGAAPTQVFPSSTGIIGVPFPDHNIRETVPELIAARSAGGRRARGLSSAILTTTKTP